MACVLGLLKQFPEQRRDGLDTSTRANGAWQSPQGGVIVHEFANGLIWDAFDHS